MRMRRYISIVNYIVLILLFSFQLKAQYEQGFKMVGGNVTASLLNDSNLNGSKNRGNSFRINPTAAFFVSDKTALGAGFLLSRNQTKFRIGESNETFSSDYGFGIMPLIRTYISSFFFSELSFGVSRNFNKGSYFSNGQVFEYSPQKSFDYIIEPSLGYSLFLNESSAIEAMFRYSYSSFSSENCCDSKQHSIGLFIGIHIFLK